MIVTINVPENVKILVKKGQLVNFDTPLWEKLTENQIEIDVAKKLGIKPEKIFNYLKKFINDQVKKDEVIAEKKGLLFEKKILSPQDGEIKEINHISGKLIISNLSNKKIINSFFEGKIEDIEKSIIKISISDGDSYLIKEGKMDFGGKIFYYQNNQNLVADNIENKIIVFDHLSPLDQIKLEALGAIAFISPRGLPEKTQLPYFQLKNIKDIEKIFYSKKTSCIILKEQSKIIFYDGK